MKTKILFILFIAAILFWQTNPVDAQTVINIPASIDNTLYEDASGATSNGAGIHFFVGRTNQPSNSLRRGLLQFAIADSLPAGVLVQTVSLTLRVSKSAGGTHDIALHKVLTEWGEGSSDASGQEGKGAAARSNDATWIHSKFNTMNWNSQGGDFSSTSSAVLAVAGTGSYTWASTDSLVANVQHWLDSPAENFGWVLIGNEAAQKTAKRFDSREHSTVLNRPMLTVTYTNTGTTDIAKAGYAKPAGFVLDQNYPNPFNPTTMIQFALPKKALVTLKVYDMMGREIAALVADEREAGVHQVEFNAGDLTNGIYVYRLVTDGFVATRKLTLLK